MKPSSEPSRRRLLFEPGPFALWFAVLVFAGFPDVVIGTGSFVLRDFNGFGFPLAAYHKTSFWRGELPLWNPLSLGGVPFLAQWNTMVLYPGSLIYLLLPLPASLGWFCLLHLYLGGLGMHRLARRLTGDGFSGAVAGVVFAWSGLVQTALMWPNNIAALGLMPWCVLVVWRACVEGRRAVLVAIGVASLQMLTGAPEVILFTWLISCAVLFVRPLNELLRRGWRFGGIVVGVIGVSAAQLLPFIDLLQHSQRLSHGQAVAWSADAGFWANLFIPVAGLQRYTNGVHFHPGQGWTHSFYVGVLVLLLAVGGGLGSASRRARTGWFTVLVVGGVAIGGNGFIYGWMDRLIPLGVMRFPVKFWLVAGFLLPLLAAWGVRTLGLARKSGERKAARPWVFSGGVVVVLFALAAGRIGTAVDRGEVVALSIINAGERGLWLLIGAGLLLWWWRERSAARVVWIQAAFVLVLWWDLKTHQPGLAPRVAPHLFGMENPDLPALQPFPAPGGGRIYRLPQTRWRTEEFADDALDRSLMRSRLELSPNLNLPEGVAMYDGFFSLWFPMYDGVGSMLWTPDRGLNPELADFLAISHTTSTNAFGVWETRPTAHPWITAGQRPRFVDTRDALQRIGNGWWDAGREVFLGAVHKAGVVAGEDREAQVKAVVFGAQRVRFEVEAVSPTVAVISQFYHRWWTAMVDGEEVKVLPANLGFQAVVVPAGRHVVELRYIDRWFQAGMAISLLSLAVLGACWWRMWARAMSRPPMGE